MIPSPRHMEFNDWACATLDSIPGLRTFPPPSGEETWRSWAAELISDPVLAGKQIMGYDIAVRWQEWAESLVYAMETTT